MDAVSVSHLSFGYTKKRKILDDISFTIQEGQMAGLCGLSGCGKTTLLRILSGIIPNAYPGVLEGDAMLMGESIKGKTIRALSDTIGYAFQDADDQLFLTTVEDELAFGLENRCVPPKEIRERVEETLNKWGLSGFRLQNPGTLSGGQKRLTALASLLITGPQILALDEPMSHLDEDGRRLMQSAIEELRREGKTILIVEHDLNHIKNADAWILMNNGRIAAKDTPENLWREKDLLREARLYLEGPNHPGKRIL